MEEWKDIPWYEWQYQASDLWRIRNIKFRWHNEIHILSESYSKDWYCIVALNRDPKKVHRLIAITFLPNPDNKETVNHIDGDKKNNTKSNLEWATRSENMLHAFATGLKTVTKNHHFYTNHPRTSKWKFWQLSKKAKLIHQYTMAWDFIKEWYWWAEVERETWIRQSAVSACCLWKIKHAGWYKWMYITP